MRGVLTVATAVVVLVAGWTLGDDASPSGPGTSVPRSPQPAPADPVAEQPPATTTLLQPAPHGDGDSWRDTAGEEYRLGLVNAPEQGECFGAEATAERRRQVADGFRADVYTVDRYGRGVSVVTTADGSNLNLHLARHGFVDDRYLAGFRHEHPQLAAELDRAFADARAQGRGLWSACRGPQQPAPAAAPAGTACHPAYLTCVPVADDLDCGDVAGPVQARQAGVDPYRLDADGDGVGCDG